MSWRAVVLEVEMSPDEKSDKSRTGNIGPIDKSKQGSETLGGPLSKARPESGQVGRKIVGQGKRREALKKWVKKD